MKRQRGFILATVFFVLVVMIFLAASLFRLVPTELQWASNLRQDTEAYYAATAGIKHAIAWLSVVTDPSKAVGRTFSPPFNPFGPSAGQPYQTASLTNPAEEPWRLKPQVPVVTPSPTDDTYFPPMDANANPIKHPVLMTAPGAAAGLRLDDDWTATVLIFPDKYTSPHPFMDVPTNLLRPPCYIIVAAAFQDVNRNGVRDLGERYVMRAEATVVQGTFARYAYFIDKWPYLPDRKRFVLSKGNTRPILDGPFHTNDPPVLEVGDPGGDAFFTETNPPHFASELNIAGRLATLPGFSGTLTHDGIAWEGGNFNGSSPDNRPFNDSNEAVDGRYERMFARGEAAIRFVDRIEIPADSDRIARSAFGVTDPTAVPDVTAAGSSELYVPNAAGKVRGGTVFSGGLKSCFLDVLNASGAEVGTDSYNSPPPSAAGLVGAVKAVHNHDIVYPTSTQNFDETTFGSEEVTLTGPATVTAYDDNPADSIGEFEARGAATGTDTRTVNVPEFGPIVGPPPPSQPAPPGSNAAGPPRTTFGMTGSHEETQVVTLYATETYYGHLVTLADGTPYQSTQQIILNEIHEQRTYYDTYSPTDLVVDNRESTAVTLNSAYLQGPGVQPIFYDGTAFNNQLVLPAGKVAVIHQYRFDPFHHEFEILDGPLNGVVQAMGPIGSLKGWNKYPKTVLAESRSWTSATQSSGQQWPITVTGPLRQFGLAEGLMPTSSDHSLGIIGSEILLNPPAALFGPMFSEGFGNDQKPLSMVCALLATKKGFSIPPTGTMVNGSKLGYVKVAGSVAQAEFGALSLGTYGFGQIYRYDPYLTLGPPPVYPLDTSFTMYFFRVDPL